MTRSILACTITFSLVAIGASAGQHGHGPAPKPAPAPHVHAGPPPAGPKTTTTHGSSTAAHGHVTTTTTHTTTGTKSGGHSKTTTVTSTSTLSPVQQKLTRNTNLASKLQSRLPAGTDLMTAASGFRNLGQFVAAVNVSNNLGIRFTDLKTRMVGEGMSLGQAIHELRPSTDPAVARRAETDADAFVRTYDSTATTKSTAKSRTKPPTKTTARRHGGD